MPTLKLSSKEAATLKAKRSRDKAWNTTLQAVVEKVKPRLKKADPIEAAITQAILQDIRKLMR
jgi:hypothetical protein